MQTLYYNVCLPLSESLFALLIAHCAPAMAENEPQRERERERFDGDQSFERFTQTVPVKTILAIRNL